MRNIYIILLGFAVLFTACEDQLEDKIYDKLVPSTYFNNDGEAVAAVNTLYGVLNGNGWSYYGGGNERIQMGNDAMTDVFAPASGSGMWYELNTFTYKSDMGMFHQNWVYPFKGISDANYIIEFLPEATGVSDDTKKQVIAEAKAFVAFFYWDLVKNYGDVPLMTSFSTAVLDKPTQSPMADVIAYANGLLDEAIVDLPKQYANESNFGRMTKGVCYALKMKFCEELRDWQGVIDATTAIKGLNVYEIVNNYEDVFAFDNANCPEIIFGKQSDRDFNIGNTMLTYCLPSDFQPPAGIDVQKWDSYRVRRDFYNSFDPMDNRRKPLVLEYPNTEGGTTVLGEDAHAVCLKYGWDASAHIVFASNSTVILRYADVLLSRAESITRKSKTVGQEAIDLINDVRGRSFDFDVEKMVKVSDFSNDTELLKYILQEKGWELYYEGHRRSDLIRHGEFINKAIERGAEDTGNHRKIWPVPQGELDKNENLKPTPGY